jgi:hypothetical protein
MDPLPSVAKAFAMVQQRERKNPNFDLFDGKSISLVANTTWKNNN